MPPRSALPFNININIRDLVLVVGVAAVVLALSVTAVGVRPAGGGPDQLDVGSFTPGPAGPAWAESLGRSEAVPASPAQPAAIVPQPKRPAHVPGDGLRRDPLTTRDPIDPRAYLRETASNLSRRSWMATGEPGD
jgi:hypothetical protein